MTTAERIVYGTVDAERATPLNSNSEFNQAENKKEPRCGLKARLVTAGILAVAVTLGCLVYYFGTTK